MSIFGAQPAQKAHGRAPVTYRHVLSSQAMTVFNPLRTIGHCDIDGAFAQFEQVRLGLPDDVPLVCAQWDSLIAVNYPARKYGIKRMHNVNDAKKLCPGLIVQHVATYREGESEAGYWDDVDRRTHKVSLDPYRRESLKILAVFREMAPKGELEKASIDEAFIDMTPMVIDRLLEIHPYLRAVPEDAPDGLDTPLPPAPPIDWSKAGHVFPIKPKDEEISEDEADGEEEVATWEDWALCLGAEMMGAVRAEVWRRLHYTCSAGIAHNKTIAKLCSAWKKPNAQTVMRLAATPAFLRDMDFTEIRNLGGKLGNAIAEEFKAKTVGDMLTVSLDEMQAKFGEESIWIYNILRGIDHTEVKEKLATKSMLASKNTIPNVRTHEQGHHWLNVLAGELTVRLKEARGVQPGLWPKTLVLSTRVGGDGRTRQLPFPYTRNLTAEYIVKHARRLWDEQTVGIKPGAMKFNNISLQFTGLEKLEDGQRGIEGFFAAKRERDEASTLSEKIDKKPRVEDVNATRVATPPPAPKRAHTPLSSYLSQRRSEDKASPVAKLDMEVDDEVVEIAPPPSTATCERCGEQLPDDRARAEHEDYHYALDLQAQYGGIASAPRVETPVPARKNGGTKKTKKKPDGIKAFFAPKK